MTRVSKSPTHQYYLLHPEKRGRMQLPVPIDEAATARINARMAATTSERIAVEAERKELLKPLDKRLKELKDTERALDGELKTGQTLAEVEVEERANFEEGIAWTVRRDTGMEVPDTRRELTHAERNAFTKSPDGGVERVLPRRGEEPTEDEDDDGDDQPVVPAQDGEPPAEPGTEAEQVGEYNEGDIPGSELPADEQDQTSGYQQVIAEQGKRGRESEEQPARSTAAPAARFDLPGPLSRYHALRFAPVGMVSLYLDDSLIAQGRFDVGKDELIFTQGEDRVPAKVRESVNEAIRYGDLPIPAPAAQPAAEPPQDSSAAAAPLKLTEHDASALKVLAERGPLLIETVGSATRNRKPGTTANRLESAGYVTRHEGTLTITEEGRKAIGAPPAAPAEDAPTEAGDEIPFGKEG